MKDETRAALSDQATWLRLPVMLLFFLLLQVAIPLLIVVSLVAWLMRLFTGQQPQGVIEFGRTIGEWFDRTSDYLCGGAQRRPFPFEDHDCPSDRAADAVPAARSSARPSGQNGDAGTPARPTESPGTGSAGQEAVMAEESVPKASTGKVSSGKTASRKKSTNKPTGKKSANKKSTSKKSSTRPPSRKTAANQSGKKTGGKKTAATQSSSKDSGQASGDSSGKSAGTAPSDGDQKPSDTAD